MESDPKAEEGIAFQVPVPYRAAFYGILLVWTVGTIPPIWMKFQRDVFQGDWLFGVMIAFFYAYTWYWAAGLFYRVDVEEGGKVRLKSIRRTLVVPMVQINTIEGSRLPGGFGFVRMKLPRESAYLFCHRREAGLEEIFRRIRSANPLLRTARI